MNHPAFAQQADCRTARGIAVLPVAGVRFAGVMPGLRPRGPAPPRR